MDICGGQITARFAEELSLSCNLTQQPDYDFTSEISPSFLPTSNRKRFLSYWDLISCKSRGKKHCELTLKATEEEEEETQEVTASLAKETSMGAAVLPELDGIYTLKGGQRTALIGWTTLLPTGFSKSFVKERDAPQTQAKIVVKNH